MYDTPAYGSFDRRTYSTRPLYNLALVFHIRVPALLRALAVYRESVPRRVWSARLELTRSMCATTRHRDYLFKFRRSHVDNIVQKYIDDPVMQESIDVDQE